MRQVKRALLVLVTFSLLLGIGYPLGLTGIATALFPRQAAGTLTIAGTHVLGSELIGQMFRSPRYFHGRPSVTDPAYDASGSGGSNLGPTNRRLITEASQRIQQVRQENGLSSAAPIPADLVLASASGLDPHISLESAMLQVRRIARVRELPESELSKLVLHYRERPWLGVWGKERINVLKLNLAIDQLQKKNIS